MADPSDIGIGIGIGIGMGVGVDVGMDVDEAGGSLESIVPVVAVGALALEPREMILVAGGPDDFPKLNGTAMVAGEPPIDMPVLPLISAIKWLYSELSFSCLLRLSCSISELFRLTQSRAM